LYNKYKKQRKVRGRHCSKRPGTPSRRARPVLGSPSWCEAISHSEGYINQTFWRAGSAPWLCYWGRAFREEEA